MISTAKAEQLSQSEVDAVNFATLNLDYQGGEIQLAEISQEYVLTTVVTYYGLEPAGDRMYDLTRKQIRLNYNEPEFFECWSAGSSTDVDCFNQYVLPQWNRQLSINDFIHRKYLASFQTHGRNPLSNALRRLLMS